MKTGVLLNIFMKTVIHLIFFFQDSLMNRKIKVTVIKCNFDSNKNVTVTLYLKGCA